MTIAHYSLSTDSCPAPFRSTPASHLSRPSANIPIFLSPARPSAIGCRLSASGCRPSAIPRKLLISDSFPRSPLTAFLPTLAHPAAKSFPCVSYENIGGWESGPTKGSDEALSLSRRDRFSALRLRVRCLHQPGPGVSAVSPSFLRPRTHRTPPLLPICRLRPHQPLRDTGTSASVATESVTRLRHDQPHR